MSSPNDPVLCCPLAHIVSLQYLSRSSLHRLAGLPCRLFLSYGIQVVTREVHRSVFEAVNMPCPGPFHFSHSVDYIFMSFVLSLTQMLVLLSLYVMLSILLSILVCAAASFFCACLVSVQVSAPYVFAGSTQELYTCLFRQMARLLLKISRCLAKSVRYRSSVGTVSLAVISVKTTFYIGLCKSVITNERYNICMYHVRAWDTLTMFEVQSPTGNIVG